MEFTYQPLDIEVEGISFSAANGATNNYYVFTKDIHLMGFELCAGVGAVGSTLDVIIEYPYAGGWKRWKKICKSLNLFPGELDRFIFFPQEVTGGMRLNFKMTNIEVGAITCAVDLFKFSDISAIDKSNGSEGEDW